MDVGDLDVMPETEVRALLTDCCASPAWVDGMIDARPWRDRDGILAAADQVWAACPREAIVDAIAHHPPLGRGKAAARLSEREKAWSAEEQGGAGSAEVRVRYRLNRANIDYTRRFGHTFILCATGLKAEDMLQAMRVRMMNDPETELMITAHELHKITRLRLEKLIADDTQREAS